MKLGIGRSKTIWADSQNGHHKMVNLHPFDVSESLATSDSCASLYAADPNGLKRTIAEMGTVCGR